MGPKAKPSAYINFSNQERASIKAEMPNATFGQIGKETGARWRKLSPEQQNSYKK